MRYCAIIGDIVNSRKFDDRNKIQNELKENIAEINSRYEDALAARFMIYAGDEIQGLLKVPSLSYQIIKDLKETLSFVDLVFGAGIGGLSTDIPPDAVTWELDGEAYHLARNIFEKTREKRRNIGYSFSGDREGAGVSPECKLINSLLYFIHSNESYRTSRQKKIVELYEEYENQTKVADILGISQGAVSKTLNKALYYEIKEAEESIVNYLKIFDNNL